MTELRFADYESHILDLVQAGMQAADPAKALASNWPSTLDQAQNCYVVGIGKAALELALEIEKKLGDRLKGGAVAVVPERLARLSEPPTRFKAYPAAHPLPDQRNIEAARAIAMVAHGLGPEDNLIAVISGGGSAHLTLPVDDLKLEDLRAITEALQHAGATVTHLNTVRKHLELLKGGGLARLAYPARVWSFILSDVVGDSLNVIGSGPTAPDPTTFADALEVLKYFNLVDRVPAVRDHLQAGVRGEREETLLPGNELMVNVRNMLIGSNRMALGAVRRRATDAGWRVVGYELGIQDEARLQGMSLALRGMDMLNRPDLPCCWLMGGETTVTVHGKGSGGRNQEAALAAALSIDGIDHLAVACFATDGIDGPTDAAGAIVTGATYKRAKEMGVDPQDYLNNNDSYHFFEKIGGLIKLGATGTNVNDILIALAYPKTAD